MSGPPKPANRHRAWRPERSNAPDGPQPDPTPPSLPRFAPARQLVGPSPPSSTRPERPSPLVMRQARSAAAAASIRRPSPVNGASGRRVGRPRRRMAGLRTAGWGGRGGRATTRAQASVARRPRSGAPRRSTRTRVRRSGRPRGPAPTQLGQDLVPGPAPQPQEGEGVGVELVGDQVADGGGVLAGDRPVGARAAGHDLAGRGQELDTDGPGVLDDPGVQLAVQQGRGVGRLGP